MTMLVATSYFGNRIIRHVGADVRKLRHEGFDIVVHTFSEGDLRFYRKTVRDIVDVTKETGMHVWIDPWGVGGVFGGETFSDAALHHQDWLQVAADGNKLPACCPSNPGFQGFMCDWTDAALETGADAVFWDEPHFYSDENQRAPCHCKYCRDLAEQGKPAIGTFLRDVCDRVQSRGGQNVKSTIAAGQLGIDVIAIWGFDACESMSFLSCERPRIAWAAFLKGIAQLRG